MRVAMVGLGKMGGNMTARLLKKGHEVVAFDRDSLAVQRAAKLGARPATDLQSVVGGLQAPRVVWIMVPAGAPVDETIETHLESGAEVDFGVHGAIRELFRLDPDRELPLPVDFIVAATAG